MARDLALEARRTRRQVPRFCNRRVDVYRTISARVSARHHARKKSRAIGPLRDTCRLGRRRGGWRSIVPRGPHIPGSRGKTPLKSLELLVKVVSILVALSSILLEKFDDD